MHRLTLLCVGKLHGGWIAEGCEDFLHRLKHHARVEIRELPPSREKDAGRQCGDESSRLLAAMGKQKGDVIVLDEKGERMTSREFALLLSQCFDSGTPATFVIGGAYGLTEEVRKGAKAVVKLSDMTYTHEMARLILLEQVYRALEIQRGSGYHH